MEKTKCKCGAFINNLAEPLEEAIRLHAKIVHRVKDDGEIGSWIADFCKFQRV